MVAMGEGTGADGGRTIDLHAHSAVSDGTESPAELVRSALAAGLDAVALTDHDTVAGWHEAMAAARGTSLTVVPGLEISTRHEGLSVHLLAYGIDPSPSTDLARRLVRVRDSRLTRAERMVERLGADYPITWSGVIEVAESHGVTAGSIGRPHIADALVAARVVPHRAAAFEGVLSGASPYYVRYEGIETATAIAAVHEAGGVAVAAHVLSEGRGRRRVQDSQVCELAELGMDGIEIDHREHTEAQRERLRHLAERLGLIRTGGSDYHGSGKPNRLGENLTAPDQFDALMRRVQAPK